MAQRRAASDRGIAIVAALWASAMLAIMSLSVLQIVRADARVGRGSLDVAALNAVADAAVNITILSMLGPRATQPPLNRVPVDVPFAGYTARVTVQDEAGKIDLNRASDAVLRQLLLDAGLDGASAAEIAARIIAWRGTDPAVQSEPGAPGAAVHRQLFQSVEEAQLIPGITPALYDRIAPLLTVYSQTAGIDPAFAGLRVLNVFRPLDPSADAAWRRLEEQRAGLRPPDPNPGVAVGHAFTIIAAVGTATARVVRTAVIRLTGQPRAPLLIYRWD